MELLPILPLRSDEPSSGKGDSVDEEVGPESKIFSIRTRCGECASPKGECER